MEEKKNIKKNKIVKVTALLGLFLLVFGVSYALFTVVLNGTKRNKITTGNLGLVLTDTSGNTEEEGYGVNLENILPMPQEEGLKTEPYKFVVKNTGNIPVSYTLKLNDIEGIENTLQDEYIRYNLITQDYLKEYQEGNFAQGYFSTEKIVDGATNSMTEASPKLSDAADRILDGTTILPGESIEYTLNLWLDEEATTEQAANKTFEGKIEVNGEQATIYTTGASGENIDYILYNDGTLILTGEGKMNGVFFNDNGDVTETNNNVAPTYDIIYKYFEKNGLAISNCTSKTINSYMLLGASYYEGINPFINGPYIEETKKELQYDDLEYLVELINELPKINRIVVGEGITEISSVFIYYFQNMITLPTTLKTISSSSLTVIPYLNIPNSVAYIGRGGLTTIGVINIDNSKEYAASHFDESWSSDSITINYLR